MQSPCWPGRRGYTLIELLVVVCILMVLMGLVLPAVQAVRQMAARAQCFSNLKQLGLAVQHYHDCNGTMPRYYGVSASLCNSPYPDIPLTNRTRPYGGWLVPLLPFIEQQTVYDALMAEITTSGWNHPYTDSAGITYYHGVWAHPIHEATYKILQCSLDPTAGTPTGTCEGGNWGSTNYLANYNAWGTGYGGPWTPPVRLAQITDGLSNTILFGEGYSNCNTVGRIALLSLWYHNFGLDLNGQPNTWAFQDRPRPQDCDPLRAQSAHSGGMGVCLADGSVRVVDPAISQATWNNALLPRDGNALGNDW